MPGEELGVHAPRGLQGQPVARQSRFHGCRLVHPFHAASDVFAAKAS